MSALQKVGALVWIYDQLTQVVEAAEIAQQAADPATREKEKRWGQVLQSSIRLKQQARIYTKCVIA